MPTESGTEELKVSQSSPSDIDAKTSTAALLITEYVNGVLTRLGDEAESTLKAVKEMLNELNTCLHNLKTDIESIIFRCKSHNLLITLSKINELDLKIEQLSQIEEVLPFEFIDKIVTETESQLLCSTLGLVERFTDKMKEINDDRVLHKSPFYIVNNLIDDDEKMNVKINSEPSDRNINSALSLIGFTEEKSKEIAYYISCHPETRHSPIYWAKKYIRKTFNKHPLLTMMPFLDMHSNEPTNHWFDIEADLLAKCNEHAIRLRIQMIQLEYFSENLTSETIDTKFHQIGHTLLFHGAIAASSVDTILRKGILLNRGKTNQDFSHGNGFYLSEEFEVAEEWVRKRGSRPNGIIVYRVPNHLLALGSSAGLDLTGNEQLLFKVVKYHRTGCLYTSDNDLVNVSRYSFIKGIVSKNGLRIRKGRAHSLKPYLFNGKTIQQFCIRSEKLAGEMSSCVIAIIIRK